MSAVESRPAAAPWGSLSTTGVYRVPVSGETVVDPVPGLDANALVGRLRDDALDLTISTLRPESATGGINAVRSGAVSALSGAGFLLAGLHVGYVSTTFTIALSHHIELRVPGTGASSQERPADLAPAAYRAFKDLARWLDAEDTQVADMVGIGRTTPYTWVREGREPRPATSQGIYEHHATLDSLQRRLGSDGFRRWLHAGIPSRREIILSGALRRLEPDVHDLLFRLPADRRVDLSAAPEDTTQAPTSSTGPTVRPSGRRPRRAPG